VELGYKNDKISENLTYWYKRVEIGLSIVTYPSLLLLLLVRQPTL